MNAQSVLLARCADQRWREGFFAAANLMMSGGLDRDVIDALESQVQFPGQPAVELLAAARGVPPEVLLQTTLAAERVVWASFFKSAGLLSDSDPTPEDVEAGRVAARLFAALDDANAALDRATDCFSSTPEPPCPLAAMQEQQHRAARKVA